MTLFSFLHWAGGIPTISRKVSAKNLAFFMAGHTAPVYIGTALSGVGLYNLGLMMTGYSTPHTTPQVPNRAGRSIEIIRENARRFEGGEASAGAVPREARLEGSVGMELCGSGMRGT